MIDPNFLNGSPASEVFGQIPGRDEVIRRLIFEAFQQKNQFRFNLINNALAGVANFSAGGFTNAAFNSIKAAAQQDRINQVTSVQIRSINVPSPIDIEFEENGEVKTIRNIKRPGTVTITFIENEKGDVISMINDWRKDIVTSIPVGLAGAAQFAASTFGQSPGSGKIKYMLSDNQVRAKKLGILYLDSGTSKEKTDAYKNVIEKREAELAKAFLGDSASRKSIEDSIKLRVQREQQQQRYKLEKTYNISNAFPRDTTAVSNFNRTSNNPLQKKEYPRICLHGMNYMSQGPIEVSQDEGGALLYTCEFSVDEIGIPSKSLF